MTMDVVTPTLATNNAESAEFLSMPNAVLLLASAIYQLEIITWINLAI